MGSINLQYWHLLPYFCHNRLFSEALSDLADKLTVIRFQSRLYLFTFVSFRQNYLRIRRFVSDKFWQFIITKSWYIFFITLHSIIMVEITLFNDIFLHFWLSVFLICFLLLLVFNNLSLQRNFTEIYWQLFVLQKISIMVMRVY